MSQTVLSIRGELFYINGSLVYGEIPGCPESSRGLLMNARFIQGIFDDTADVSRFHRFLRRFDPEENTDALIAALPRWYDVGLRAFTVGFQGGGPCFTTNNSTIDNNGFSSDGLSIKPAYAARMTRLLDAADRLGFAVIVSLFYAGQIARLDGAQAVLNAVRTACTYFQLGGWKNIILEVANEYDIPPFKPFPLIQTAQGMVALIDLARRESGLPVGSSGGGGTVEKEVIEASDVVFFHGNGQARQQMCSAFKRSGAGHLKNPSFAMRTPRRCPTCRYAWIMACPGVTTTTSPSRNRRRIGPLHRERIRSLPTAWQRPWALFCRPLGGRSSFCSWALGKGSAQTAIVSRVWLPCTRNRSTMWIFTAMASGLSAAMTILSRFTIYPIGCSRRIPAHRPSGVR